MEKITKKDFIKLLTENKSSLIASCFNKSFGSFMSEIQYKPLTLTNIRAVTEIHKTYLLFDDNSRLNLNDEGRHDYIKLISNDGAIFLAKRDILQVRDYDKEELIWRLKHIDSGELYKEQENFIVYVLV